jgi:heme/copper-type cytochrome/quinol oxidase subunit 2
VRTINVKVHGGKVSGDSGRITVPLGTPIVLSVTSDVADEIHVHGYDRKAKVPAGATGSVAFTAKTPGVFEVELENSKLQLLQLQVG